MLNYEKKMTKEKEIFKRTCIVIIVNYIISGLKVLLQDTSVKIAGSLTPFNQIKIVNSE
jgi:hypothetical protein